MVPPYAPGAAQAVQDICLHHSPTDPHVGFAHCTTKSESSSHPKGVVVQQRAQMRQWQDMQPGTRLRLRGRLRQAKSTPVVPLCSSVRMRLPHSSFQRCGPHQQKDMHLVTKVRKDFGDQTRNPTGGGKEGHWAGFLQPVNAQNTKPNRQASLAPLSY